MLVPAFLAFAIVPIGGTITIAHHTTRLQLADPPWGILFLLMMSSDRRVRRDAGRLGVGVQVPAARLGAGLAQMVSYEAVLGLSIVTVVLRDRVACGPAPSSPPSTAAFLIHWNIIRTGDRPLRRLSASPSPPR